MNKMKRSVSTTAQAVVSGASKRNASAAEATAAEDSSHATSSRKTALPPISESPAEHEYLKIHWEKKWILQSSSIAIVWLCIIFFSSIRKLRSHLTRISESTAELTKISIESEFAIREHCDSLRQQVDIARETAIENIHKASNASMVDIDTYERKCLSDWTTVKVSTEKVVEDVSKRTRAFLAEQQAYLQGVKASDTQLSFLFCFYFSMKKIFNLRFDLFMIPKKSNIFGA